MRPLVLLPIVFALACPPSNDAGDEETNGDEDIMFPDEREAARDARHPASDNVAQGEAALARGNIDEAKSFFEAAVAENDQDPRAHLDLGLVLELGNDYNAAETHYRKALEIDGDFAQALNNLGLLLRDRERAEEAIPMLRRATELDPSLGEAWVNLAMSLEEVGDDSGAREAYREAVRRLPNDANARANLGLLLVRLGDADQAAIELRRAIPLARGDAAALQAVGNGLRMVGQGGPAVQALTLAIEAHEPTPALLSELALAHRANDDRESAKTALRQAIELDAAFATAHTLLGSLLAADQQYAEAVRHFERYLQLEPNGPHAERTRRHLEVARRAALR